MYAPGHVGLALLAYAPVGAKTAGRGRERLALVGMVVVAALATVPDVDLYVAALAHRGMTHTVWFALGAGLLLSAAWSWRSAVPAVWAGGIGVVTVLAHLAGDVVTPMGLRPFAPAVDTHYTLSLVKSRSPNVNRALFGAGSGTAALSLGRTVGPVDDELTAGRLPEQAYRYATADRSAAGPRPPLDRLDGTLATPT